MKTAAAYIRVSTEDQVEYSPESQIKAIQGYAKRNNLILPKKFIFMDEGISGRTTAKRPSFVTMIATAKTQPKPFDVILVWKFSRFARSREDSVVYKSMLRKQCGIDVVSISENLGDDKMAILFEAMIEAMDEYYSINLSEEVKRGMTEKAERGGVLSIPAFGYDINHGEFIMKEDEAAVIRKVFSDYLDGKGFLTIAKELNAMGVKTHRGNMIENRTVEYWLHNPVYIGEIRWNPDGATDRDYCNKNLIIRQGKHEPIIDRDTWERVQEKLLENKRLYRKHAIEHDKKQVSHWLVGILRCGVCGATLANCGGYFYCGRKCKGLCKGNACINVNTAEEIVLQELKSILSEEIKSIERLPLYQKVEKEDGLSIFQFQIQKEKRKLSRAAEAYENGVDTLEEYKKNKEKILSTIDGLNEKIMQLRDKNNTAAGPVSCPKKEVQRLLDILKSPDVDNNIKNKMVKSIIKEIVKSGNDGKTLKIIFWDMT